MNRLTGSSALAVEVQVLRAGAAASAERIKALEARVRKLEWVLRGMIAAASNNLTDRSKQHNLEVALEVLKEADQ